MKTKHSRRDFLRVTSAGAIGAFAISNDLLKKSDLTASESFVPDPKSFGIGLQLYTIRSAMRKDVPGSLKKVSDAGYKYVEPADYIDRKFYGTEPSVFKKMVNDLGMEVLSSHASVDAKALRWMKQKK